jgi:hypothetical protein
LNNFRPLFLPPCWSLTESCWSVYKYPLGSMRIPSCFTYLLLISERKEWNISFSFFWNSYLFYTMKEMTECFLSLNYCLFLTADGGDIYITFSKIVLCNGNAFHVCTVRTVSSNKQSHFHIYILTYLLTPWSRVLLEELTVFQLVNKFHAFYGTPKFITAFTTSRHLSLSWAFLCEYFVTGYVFTVRSCQHIAQTPSWKTTTCRLPATDYSIYLQLLSILEAVPPSATWGRAIPWWQGPIYHGSHFLLR